MPRYGFNFQWMFDKDAGNSVPPPDEKALDFLAHFGFNFIRVPTDYRIWTREFDYFHPNEKIFEFLDQYIAACRSRNIQMSLNLHRAPGYCISRNDLEKHNLWIDKEVQDAFVFLWEFFARRYKGIPNDHLSFDLVNEPPNINQYGLTRENYDALVRRTVAAIRSIDPGREIVIDGLAVGHVALPELADLGVIHSGRGYQPMTVSHFGATWWHDHLKCPSPPAYPGPGIPGENCFWNRDSLRNFYKPWRDLQAQGVRVHIGEMGCYNKVPNDIALRWLADLLGIFKEFSWGYSMWEFEGAFGIINHGRVGTTYENIQGYQVDRSLLDLMLNNRR